MPSTYKIITEEKQLHQVIAYCKQTGYACVDFESNGHSATSSLFLPTILGISFQPGSAWILPLAHFDSPFKHKWEKLLKLVGKELISNPAITKIAQNLKYEYQVFKRYDIEMKGRLFDTMLAKYLLNEVPPHGLKPMVVSYLPEFAHYEENYVGANLPWDEKPLEGLSKYCGLDCDLTFRLMVHFEKKLIEHDFYFLFRNMLMMATRVLGDSEYHGMHIDRKYLEQLLVIYEDKIATTLDKLQNNKKIKKFEKSLIEQRIQKHIEGIEDEIDALKAEIKDSDDDVAIGRKKKSIKSREEKISRILAKDLTTKKELELLEPVNFASTPQMIELLYKNDHGFKFKAQDFTETGAPSTGEETLLKLQSKDKSGFLTDLLEYRGLTKLYSTYVLGMHNKLSEDDRVHARFLLEGTVTGRLSSREPNLQNIPRDTTASDIKKMFTVPKGMILLQLDYSQAELRVMAAAAGETNMIQWFKEGRDIHLAVACKKNNWEYDWALKVLEKEDKNDPDFTKVKTERKFAKTINFGIIYGQTSKKLSISLECSETEAKKYLIQYNKDFPKIAEFIKKQNDYVLEYGYVKNLFGRKRRLPNIDSNVWHEFAEAQRQSVNAPIQGAASDYALFSSILIWERIRDGVLPKYMPQVYTVHDSLGYYIYPQEIHRVVPILSKICSNPETKEWFGFQIDDVTMKVDFELSSKSWGELGKYNPNLDYTKLV